MIIGLTVAFFIMITFNESWILSTVTFIPCVVIYMNQSGFNLVGYENTELALRSCFCIVVYGVLAYRTENLSKQSFMGRERPEKAFHRWMKIFETFPEGIALIRHNKILYANRSLKFILNVGLDNFSESDA